MTILNDMEIRKLCLPRTHTLRGLGIAQCDDRYYCTTHGTSRSLSKEDIELLEPYHGHDRLVDPMIVPFVPHQIKHDCDAPDRRIVSYGTSSMGYDVRLGRKFKIFTNVYGAVIDPLNMPENAYVDHEGDYVMIPPNSYILGHTIETFNIPRNILAVCLGKSTYARVAAICNVTPIEPGFVGEVVIEVANLSTLPLKVYAGQGIAQFLFFKGNPCETSYADRGGKYQNQTGIQPAIV